MTRNRFKPTLKRIASQACITYGLWVSGQAFCANFYVDNQFGAWFNTVHSDVNVPGTDQGMFPQSYKSTGGANTIANIGLRLEMLSFEKKRWSLGFGLGYYLSDAQRIKGDYYAISGTATPDNTYEYTIRLQSLMAEARLYFNQTNRLAYFLGGGAGLGFVDNSAVSMEPTAPPSGSSPPLGSQAVHDVHAVYALSTGVRWQLNCRWNLQTGFTQSYFGKDRVSMNAGTSSSPNYNKLEMGILRPYQLWASVGYQF
jgi:opacity protein-like surface antigen